MGRLPHPVTTTDAYLAAINEQLGKLIDLVGDSEASTTRLQEPARTPLPGSFPGAEHLRDAGIDYIEDVPTNDDSLVAINGIGPVTAKSILTTLSTVPK